MILFHHTHRCHLQSILAAGLLAYRLDWPELSDRCGIWLTIDDRPMVGRDIRIKVIIPSHDRHLLYLPKLLKKLPPQQIANMDAVAARQDGNWRDFFVYQGGLPINRFTAIEARVEYLKNAA